MKRLSLLVTILFATTILSGSDLLETYRVHGLFAIEKRLDKELASPDYWQKVLAHHASEYGYFDRKTDLLLCTKATKELALYSANSTYTLRQRTPIILGALPGDKLHEGDMRTPLGVYRIVARKEHPGPEYGPVAFVTDYPNRYDKIWGKNGHGIWLHGFPDGCDDKNATKGCIALNNRSLLQLDALLTPSKALLVITQNPIKKIAPERLAALLAFIYDWRYDWKYNRYDAYLKHYAHDLIFQGQYDYDYFRRYKRQVFERNRGRKKILRFYDLVVVPYPNSRGKRLWYVSFNEEYASGNYRFRGRKEVLVEEPSPRHFQIVVE